MKAFTLVELLVGISLMCMIALFAIPSMKHSYRKTQEVIMIEQITSIVQFARSQAWLLGQSLVLMPKFGSTDWSKGMVLFVDNPQHRPQNIIHEWNFKSPNLCISWHGFQSHNYLLFSAYLKHASMNGTFTIKHEQSTIRLLINRFGRVNVQTN